jgi:hypothetical protein
MISIGMFILFGFGLETVWMRLWVDVNGIVVSSIDVPANRPGRYHTDYVIKSADGEIRSYTAGATDATLARSLPVGTRLTKHRWELGYTVNGRWKSFPMFFYGPFLALGLWLLIAGIIRRRKGT